MRAFVSIAASAVTLVVSIFGCGSLFASTTTLVPTTTLTAETSNNTSAASTFTTSTNGNIAPGNVSKVDHHTLLYPGATTKIYTNIMYWFGPSNHIQVGYQSDDPAQVYKQVDDHVSRGIDGAIIDWYGPSHVVDDTATQYMMRYAEALPGLPFHFAIMEDKGALWLCANTSGCDLNQQLISDLSYIYNMYEGSPAYMKVNGRPAVFFFGLEAFNINWDYVKSNAPGNPLFIFENASGYTHADTGGAFGWVMINTSDPTDWKQSYLDNFYSQSLNFPSAYTLGSTYKGFNDTAASWSLDRIMNQNCGQVWLNTWNELGKYYNSSNQLDAMQIATWNDYEEGTEVETGIDNCVSVTASLAGDVLDWSITGNENTIDHYTVFASTDGENLMALADASRGVHALDLSQFGLGPGSYTLYVKATGRPSITNKISEAVPYDVLDRSPIASLTVSPASGTAPINVSASTAGSTAPDSNIAASTIDFGDGTRVSATTASHTYTTAGIYMVTGTVTDAYGVSSSATATLTVLPPAKMTVTCSRCGPKPKSHVRLSGVTVPTGGPTAPVTQQRVPVIRVRNTRQRRSFRHSLCDQPDARLSKLPCHRQFTH